MIIYTDLDSTISNFDEVLLDLLNNANETHYSSSDVTYWHWYDDNFPGWYKELERPEFWKCVQINPEAVEVLETAVKTGHQVYIATASSFTDSLGFKIRNTLKAFNPDLINEHNVIVAHDKHLLQGDILIDDRGSNLTMFRGLGILLNKPWNKYYETSKYQPCNRVNNWDEIANIILV